MVRASPAGLVARASQPFASVANDVRWPPGATIADAALPVRSIVVTLPSASVIDTGYPSAS